MLQCDAREVQAVKDALTVDPNNLGVGILHDPTGQLRLAPYNDLGGGHDLLTSRFQWPNQQCKGYVVVRLPDGSFDAVNLSHLNGPQGQPGSLQMDRALFQTILTALRQAGL